MYNNFVFDMPTRVLFGVGSLNQLRNEKLPGKKALIVTSNGKSTKNMVILPVWKRNWNWQAWSMNLFDEIRPNPTRSNVMDGAQKAKKKPVVTLLLRWAAVLLWTAQSVLLL
jgi:alcohol dehydrogenase